MATMEMSQAKSHATSQAMLQWRREGGRYFRGGPPRIE